MKILVTDGMDKTALEQLKANGHEVVEQFYPSEELGAALRDFDAVVVRSATKVRASHIDAAKGGRLKLVIRGGVGVDNIDVKYAEDNGITVQLRGGAGHGPHVLLRPVPFRGGPHHAGGQMGEEGLRQGL